MDNPMLNKVAIWLVIVGGLNWLLAGIGNLAELTIIEGGIVAGLLGEVAGGMVENIIYIVIGLATILVLLKTLKGSQ